MSIVPTIHDKLKGAQMSADSYKVLYEAKAKECEDLKIRIDFIKAYLNPADTSFRQMIDSFLELSDEDQQKIIELTRALANVRRPLK